MPCSRVNVFFHRELLNEAYGEDSDEDALLPRHGPPTSSAPPGQDARNARSTRAGNGCGPAPAQSDPPPAAWRYGFSLYGYLPSLSGTSSAPADAGGTPISIDADKLVDSLKFTVMGAFEAHNGRWGLFTDLLYLNLGGNKQQSRDFTLGGAAPPAGTTASLDWDFKGAIWTLGGEYRVFADPTVTVDALAGVRWFDVKTTSRWSITGNLGPILPAGRSAAPRTR